MFATRFGAKVQKQAFAQLKSRNASSLPTTLYQNVWRKSNVLYITYVATGCLVLGSVYGSVVSFIWEANNRGKLYHHIDWTKFKCEDDDEE